MALAIGTRLNHYRITASLGAEGMGKVYAVEDLNLGRQLALKLLPVEYTRETDRVRRFNQEARAASALNHPNIITIHEIGQSEVGHYIVMELVTGRTLREMIGQPCSTETLSSVAKQMAQALRVAHDAGIIHRDIKPENIMVRSDGYVKILDFGLARLAPLKTEDSEAETLSPTTARYCPWHDTLHVSRAGERRNTDECDGHLFAGTGAVRTGHRTSSI